MGCGGWDMPRVRGWVERRVLQLEGFADQIIIDPTVLLVPRPSDYARAHLPPYDYIAFGANDYALLREVALKHCSLTFYLNGADYAGSRHAPNVKWFVHRHGRGGQADAAVRGHTGREELPEARCQEPRHELPGAVHVEGGELRVTECTWRGSGASNDEGGALRVSNGSTLVEASLIEGFRSTGGAIAVDGGSLVLASGTRLKDNAADGRHSAVL